MYFVRWIGWPGSASTLKTTWTSPFRQVASTVKAQVVSSVIDAKAQPHAASARHEGEQ